jgi:hypothetical protein
MNLGAGKGHKTAGNSDEAENHALPKLLAAHPAGRNHDI